MEASIKAKPTRYKDVIYRSRLEATWAVYFDESFGEGAVKYETILGRTKATAYRDMREFIAVCNEGLRCIEGDLHGEQYVPDFTVLFESQRGVHFWEIKPTFPGPEYLKKLRQVAAQIGMYGYPLILGCGSFKDDSVQMFQFPYTFCRALRSLDAQAYSKAANFRWDLYDHRRPG
jgi:hypothetical protein